MLLLRENLELNFGVKRNFWKYLKLINNDISVYFVFSHNITLSIHYALSPMNFAWFYTFHIEKLDNNTYTTFRQFCYYVCHRDKSDTSMKILPRTCIIFIHTMTSVAFKQYCQLWYKKMFDITFWMALLPCDHSQRLCRSKNHLDIINFGRNFMICLIIIYKNLTTRIFIFYSFTKPD